MSRKDKAASLREIIILERGGACERCGATAFLQMDLLQSDGGRHHGMSYPDRQAFYFQQHLLQNVQLLCPKCHAAKTIADVRRRRAKELLK
jgi:5-methylcytosine-specific restriction endonuclease McrA